MTAGRWPNGSRKPFRSTAIRRPRCSRDSPTCVRATVKGGILVAIVQGALGGIAFWFLGIHAALLWAVLMAFLSLIPAVGATLVWLPVAIYFLATGAVWQGIGLILYGVLVIGLVDNVLRPFLVGKETKLPDYVVLISTLGGIEVFGLNGFVIGPLIAAMFMVSWEIFSASRRTVQDSALASSQPGWSSETRHPRGSRCARPSYDPKVSTSLGPAAESHLAGNRLSVDRSSRLSEPAAALR